MYVWTICCYYEFACERKFLRHSKYQQKRTCVVGVQADVVLIYWPAVTPQLYRFLTSLYAGMLRWLKSSHPSKAEVRTPAGAYRHLSHLYFRLTSASLITVYANEKSTQIPGWRPTSLKLIHCACGHEWVKKNGKYTWQTARTACRGRLGRSPHFTKIPDPGITERWHHWGLAVRRLSWGTYHSCLQPQ